MNAIPVGTRVRITTGLKTYGLTGEIVSHPVGLWRRRSVRSMYDAGGDAVTEHHLPDGSLATVEREARQATVSRYVDGRCIWGQVFATHEVDHAARCVAEMRERPADFRRWWLPA